MTVRRLALTAAMFAFGLALGHWVYHDLWAPKPFTLSQAVVTFAVVPLAVVAYGVAWERWR